MVEQRCGLLAIARAVETPEIERDPKAWQQRQLLVNELNHRVKNSLAVVQSIASQTLRNAPDLQTASRSLSSRTRVLIGGEAAGEIAPKLGAEPLEPDPVGAARRLAEAGLAQIFNVALFIATAHLALARRPARGNDGAIDETRRAA